MIYEQVEQVSDGLSIPDRLHKKEPSFIFGDRASLLTPAETYRQMRNLSDELGEEIKTNKPSLTPFAEKRQLIGLSHFLKDQSPEEWTQADTDFQLALIKSHSIEDVRYHAAEAIGALLQKLEPQKQQAIISQLTQILTPDEINNQVVEALYRGQITQNGQHFARLPEVLRLAIKIRMGNASVSSINDFIKDNPQWAIDILQLAGKHCSPDVWLRDELTTYVKEIVKKLESDPDISANWKVRTLVAVLNQFDQLSNSAEELYQQAKTDPDEEVRIRMRRAFATRLRGQDDETINHWVDTILEDFINLPEEKLRFIAHGLVEILPNVSPKELEQIKQRLKNIARTHENGYNRKTALKTLAKITNDSDRTAETNFVIGSLQDESIIVQEEALLCLSKRIGTQLSAKQAKKILANLDLEEKDWFFRRIVAETMRQLAKTKNDWAIDPTKPDILMFSGSFDPIHLGHTEVAQKAAQITSREVWIMPRVQLQRRKRLSPIEYRERMIRKAIAELPDVYLLPKELSFRPDGSLIEESLEKLKILASFANNMGLLRGADVLDRANYNEPDNPRRNIFHVISSRGKTDVEDRLSHLGLSWQVISQSCDMSSTQIRKLLSRENLEEALIQVSPLQTQILNSQNWYKDDSLPEMLED